ncbi:MAG: hypothetical protein QM831_24370 [Kofleriaceae bacterium]
MAARQQASLTVMDGRAVGTSLRFDTAIRIGSAPYCEVIVPELAPIHAVIEPYLDESYFYRTEIPDTFVSKQPALEFEVPTHGFLQIGPVGVMVETHGGYRGKATITKSHDGVFSALSAIHAIGRLAKPRTSAAVVMLDEDTVVLAGGTTLMRGGGIFDTFETFKVSTRTTVESQMTVERLAPIAAALADRRVLIAGGNTSSAEIFDPTTHTTRAVASMQVTRTGGELFALPNGLVVALGGVRNGLWAEVYDPTKNRWGGLRSPDLHYLSAAPLSPTKFLLSAFWDYQDPKPAAFYVFDSATWRFDPVTPPIVNRRNLTLTALGHGRVLVTGGSPQEHVRAVEIFDLATQHWQRVADMPTRRSRPAITALPNGHVLVIAGESLSSGLYSGEVYDQGTNSWYALPANWDGINPLAGFARADNSAVIVGVGMVSLASDAPF